MLSTISLRKNFQFKYVYDHAKFFTDKFIVMFAIKNNLSVNRLGICVSKKVGKSYIRSRIVRLIKENYRLNEKYFLVGFDIVFVARKNIINADFYMIKKSIVNLSRKHKIFSGDIYV